MENITTDPSALSPASVDGYVFRPQEDITVHELALIVQTILDYQKSVFLPNAMSNITEECMRHFIDKRQESLQTMLYLGASKSN